VIVAAGGDVSGLAAKAATSTIPIVFASADPIKSGLVASLNRPVENATGVYILANALESKRLGLLHELFFPSATPFGVLLDPKFPPANLGASELRAAAGTIGQPLTFLNASTDAELDATFAALTQQHVMAMLLIGSPFLTRAAIRSSPSPHTRSCQPCTISVNM